MIGKYPREVTLYNYTMTSHNDFIMNNSYYIMIRRKITTTLQSTQLNPMYDTIVIYVLYV